MIITGIEQDAYFREQKAKLLGSLLYFIQVFFKFRTGRDFSLSQPQGRESHHITVCRELTKVFYLETFRLLINLPPGHYKSTMLQHFVAWAWAHYPDCQFIYLSYSHDEAAKNTAVIKSIVSLPQYKEFFGVWVSNSSSAKDDFRTNHGGVIKAFGSGGAVTGKDAGFPNCERFSGALIMDDMHKPDEVHSDTMRGSVLKNYGETIAQRVRGPNVAQIFLGQCLHEDDLAAFFKAGQDGYEWNQVVLKGLDDAGNALDPNVKTKEQLMTMEKYNEYVFHAQYQQNPQPSGGGIFKVSNFFLMDQEPNMLATFITADTAETDKTHNDYSVFSFWGIYKLNDLGRREIDEYALHWIDCMAFHAEPKDLESEFMGFYSECCMHKVTPSFAAIEKKSTGVTLSSILGEVRGLTIRNIERTRASGSKIARYFEIQPYINKKLVSLLALGKHTHQCIEHCRKVTANNTHRHDDIADTLYDAVKIALIDKHVITQYTKTDDKALVTEMAGHFKRNTEIRKSAWQLR